MILKLFQSILPQFLAHEFVSHDQAEKDSQSFMLILKNLL